MKQVVGYNEAKPVVSYDLTVEEERKKTPPLPRNSVAPILGEKGLRPEEAAAIATETYEELSANGVSEKVERLKQEDALQLKSQAVSEELASMDPDNVTNEDLLTLQAIDGMEIEGDAFAYALPKVFANLPELDNFNRLDGFVDDRDRDEFVTRIANSELDFYELAEIDRINRAIGISQKEGATVGQVFQVLQDEAERSDDVIDSGLPRDIALMLIPFLTQYNLEQTYKEFTGKSPTADLSLFMGEMNNALKQELLRIPPEDRERRARELVEIMKKNSGLLGGVRQLLPPEAVKFVNAAVESDAETYFNTLALSDTNFLTSDTDWARWIDNSFTVLDAVSLGLASKIKAGAKGISRAFRLSKGERASGLRAVSVTDDKHKVKDILALSATDDTKRINPAIGMSDEDHVGALLPNIKGDSTDPLPDYVEQTLQRGQELTTDIITRRTRTDFFNNELDQLVRDTVDKFDQDLGGRLQPTRSQIGSQEGNSFEYIAQFGSSEDLGFKSLDEAQSFVSQRLGVDAEVEYLKRDPATGEYHALDEGPTAGVEYVVRYPTKLYFPDEAAGEFNPMTGILGFVKNNWVANPATKMEERLRFAATRATDDAGYVQQKLSDIMIPFRKLKRSSQDRVIVVENAGAAEAKDYTFKELMSSTVDGKPLTSAEVAGYYSRMQTRRALWFVENKALREKMLSKNYRGVQAANFKGAARIIDPDSIPNSGYWAYNPTTNTVNSYRKADLQALYNAGGSVGELWRPVTIDGNRVSRVLIDGSSTRVTELPAQVLRYIPGYQPRHYAARWFVRRKETLRVDGRLEETEIPVAAAVDYADAQKMVARQRDPENYTIELDRVQANGVRDSESLNWELDNMMFYQQRSEQQVAALGGKEIIVDPVRSLEKQVQAVSGSLGQGRLLEILQQKYKNTFAPVLPKDARGNPLYPANKGDILKPAPDSPDARLYSEARVMHDYIRILSSGLTDFQKDFYYATLNLAATLEKKGSFGSAALARALYGLTEASTSPTALARTTAFTVQILAAPIRQLWIQSHQTLFLAGLDPSILPQTFLGDAFYLDSAFAVERSQMHDRRWLEAVSRSIRSTFGVLRNTDELDNLYQNFSKSGLPYLRSALQVEGVSDKILHTIGEFGYAAGERHNLAATYAFAYRRHLKKTGKSWQQLNDSDWEEIAFNAREYSLNMTRADAFNYQHGLLSAATQYIAIRHKAINAVLSNENFTPAERVRIAGAQMLLFGAEGAGVGMVVDSIMNKMGLTFEAIPELNMSALDVKQVVEGGLYDLIMNHTLQALLEQEEQSDVQFSRSMAALGESDRLIHSLFANLDNLALLDTAFGPSTTATSGIRRSIAEVSYIVRMQDLSTEEKIVNAVESFARVFSMGNNALKVKAGERLMLAVDSKGRPVSETTDVDMFIKRFFGFSTAQEAEYYHDLGLTGSRAGAAPGGAEGDIEEAAEILAAMIRRKTLEGRWDEAKRMASSALTLWSDDVERAAIMEKLQAKLSDPSVANIELYKKLASDLTVATEPELINQLINNSYFLRNPYQREKLKSFAEELKERGNTNE